MRGQAWELAAYGPILMALVLIALGALILIGPAIGGQLGVVHESMRDAFADDSRIVVDSVGPVRLVGAQSSTQAQRLPAVEDTHVPPLVDLPDAPVLGMDEDCAALHFQASLGIDRGYVSFGRFNVVSDTDPYGQSDPLTQWKLLQFGGFPIRMETVGPARVASIPVNETTNILISDPFTDEMLLSARWEVEAIEVRGRRASINAHLSRNLSGLGVNNAIDSPTLARFSRDGHGVLVMRFSHSDEIVAALKAGEPIYAAVTGTMYPGYCVE